MPIQSHIPSCSPSRPPRRVRAKRRFKTRRLSHFALAVLLICGAAWTPASHAQLTDTTRLQAGSAAVLANNYHPGLNLAQYWVSEKYDGVRALWDGQRLLSRQGLPIAAPAWFTANWPKEPLDGELWAGRGQFDLVQSAVASGQPQDAQWQQLRYMVFDAPAAAGLLPARQETLAQLI